MFREQNGVCCWRFVRLEAGGGHEAEEDHTPRARSSSIFLASTQEPSTSSSSRFFFLGPTTRSSWPFHLISSFTFVRLCSTWLLPLLHSLRPICPSFLCPDRSSRFLLPRDRPRGYLSRVFLATGTAEWSCVLGLMLRQEGKKEYGRWMMQGEMIGVCICVRSFRFLRVDCIKLQLIY